MSVRIGSAALDIQRQSKKDCNQTHYSDGIVFLFHVCSEEMLERIKYSYISLSIKVFHQALKH